MNFIRGYGKRTLAALILTIVFIDGTGWAQNLSELSIGDVIAIADRRMQEGNYDAALPALEEVLGRTQGMTDDQHRQTAQTCRFEIARIYYRKGDIATGMTYIENYLDNQPQPQERRALNMLAQGFFEVSDWDKILELYERLLTHSDLDREVLFNMKLLAGQAYFQKSEWELCLEPLRYAERMTEDDRIKGICQVMVARALVELEEWEQLYAWVVRVIRTERRYDITLNLTLMKGAKALYDDGEYLNALYLYRMVRPREVLSEFANRKIRELNQKMTGTNSELENKEIQNDVKRIEEGLEVLKDLAPYEQEVTFRIGQIYYDVKRFWEGYVLFDKLYQDDRDSEIGEASVLQSVMVLYAVQEYDRAEERIIEYLDEKPDGQYARTLLSLMVRDNLMRRIFPRVIELRKYIDGLPAPKEANEEMMQADLHYMLAFAYMQTVRAREAGEQFTIVLEEYPESQQYYDALYYRGMSYMLQADYANALADFKQYQEENETGDLYAESIFREGVCLYGLERIPESEAAFTLFITDYPNHNVISEAYSLRGDIEAAKPSSNEDPHPLDRAQADYRRAIDTAKITLQASYPAFQAAKVFKMESKWQEIIDLMDYYLDRWEEMADVAEAVYWIGQAQIELGQLHEEAIPAYINAIMRFGNDPQKLGVDKIISEMVNIADRYLDEDERAGLIVRLKVRMSTVEDDQEVLRLRLQVAEALLEGEDEAMALAARLVDEVDDLTITTPGSLALMCDVAVGTGDVEQMARLSDYFIENFEDSEMLWHGYRARAVARMESEDYTGVLSAIEPAQGQFGVESFMGWAQIMKAKALYALGDYEEAENEFSIALNVPAWRGPIFAEATYGMGTCRMAVSDFEGAHTFFQRTYLLYKAYDDGEWAAKGYVAAADCLNKMNRRDEAVKTLNAMLGDDYTKDSALAQQVRDQLGQ